MSIPSTESDIEVDPEQLSQWALDDPALQVIDVRETYEHDEGHIDGTRHIPLADLSTQAHTVEHDRPVVFYCRVGARSQMAAQAFRASGFQAYTLSGGLLRWADEGRPLAPEGGRVADH